MSASAPSERVPGPRARLGTGTLVLHWTVGLSVIGLLAYGFWLQTLPSGPTRTPYVQIHKSFGLLILALALTRALWRWREGFPPSAGAHAAWERRAAFRLHLFLIGATLLMPLSGILRSLAYARPVDLFGIRLIPKLFETKQEALYAVASNLHDGLAIALVLAILLHLAATLKHALIDRDGTAGRIFGRR